VNACAACRRGKVNGPLTTCRYRLLEMGKHWFSLLTIIRRRANAMLATLVLVLAHPAWAQAVTTYTNSTSGAINNTTPCTNSMVRNFTVGTSFTVADVDLGVFATHSWRGDLRITLQAPDGTRVQLVDGNTNTISGNNFNVLLNDSATQTVNTDSATGNHSTVAPPPFQNNLIPNSPLYAFNGKNSQGTWRLEICDQYPQADNGTFSYAALYLTAAPASYADLSLTMSVSPTTPVAGANVTYTLQATNSASSPTTATGVTVTAPLPAGTTFVSTNGSYNSATGEWNVGSLTPGQTKSLTITANVTAMASATVASNAEVTASSVADLDSTPNNGVTSEDDYAAASFTVQGTRVAGTPPTLSCSTGSLLFDWDINAWASGSLSNSYALAGIGTIGFAITSTGNWVNNATYGGQSPSRSNAITGGLSPGQQALHEYLDFNYQAETATTTINLPTAVPGAQFTIFDIDYNANQFADKIVVTGKYNGATVLPTLTNGTSNYVIGNTAIGDVGGNNTAANGNVVVTFSQPVDTIIVVYGNATTAPADPGGQAMAIHDITFCRPTAVLTITKLSTIIADPVNGTTNPKNIPGAVVEYCILMQNPGSGTTTNLVGTDTIPTTLTYTANSMFSGTTCAGATTAEDDDGTGADEADPFGASVSGNVLTATATTLAPSGSFALKFRTTIK
jgi:uncharacterized repeat protein (TIGR01451 family)